MPALFLGHGNPMNALETNEYTRAWRAIAEQLPKPKAVLVVSAHWFVEGTRVTIDERPRTIHDFGGFPRALFEVSYPAPGAPALAHRVTELLAPTRVEPDRDWGLDHGAWSLLVHLYPRADVPIVQLGIDETLSAHEHLALARRLRPLRDEGVLVLGSGNVVHNLHAYAWGRHPVEPFDWAIDFERRLRALIVEHRFDAIADYESMGRSAALSAPTPEHFLPLLYVLAQAEPTEPIDFPVSGVDGGAVSMLGVRVGA
jgi:4,5-DOPA dioxygenase extradiol